MNITRSEMIYNRVRDFIKYLPSDVLATLRGYLRRPKTIDFIRKELLLDKSISIENGTLYYCFLYGIDEFNEMMRQII